MLLTARPASGAAPGPRAGVALLMALLVLVLLAAIVTQIAIGTGTDARVARNEVALTSMDLAIESALLQVYDELGGDGQSEAEPGGGMGAPAPDAEGEGAAAGGEESQPVDSREDEWARIKRPMINEIELRVLVVDEDSKINVLGMLTEDSEEAEKVLERVARVLDVCREGTAEDIDGGTARDMAETIRDFLEGRPRVELARPELLTDDEDDPDQRLLLSLRELIVLEPFERHHFRDYRDEDGIVVHSIASFLTPWSSLTTQGEGDGADDEAPGSGGGAPAGGAGGGGDGGGGDGGRGEEVPESEAGGAAGGGGTPGGPPGVAVNVNTAPPVVLKSLMDEREVELRWWDKVIEYRNLEEEDEETEDGDPVFDEYGEEVIRRQVFDSLDEVHEIYGFQDFDGNTQMELDRLLTTRSNVFTIYVTARRATGEREEFAGQLGRSRDVEDAEDRKGNALVRTVRSVVWRREGEDGFEIVPLVRWDVLDYTPFEVLDFPEEDR